MEKETKEVLTIEQRIEQLKNNIQNAESEVVAWTQISLKSQGAIEVLEQILKES
tara:strand:+ start:17459 stop:17620 length:162 start_codon:yes stop_codon:yes gene_type:complete